MKRKVSRASPQQPTLPKPWLLWLALVATTAIAYQPAWFGGLLWDDPAHVTHPALRSLGGLWRIWTDVGATQQYYPLAHSVFWLQHHLWGDNLFGYHLLNITLHATSAFLIALMLRRLAVPGAVLAAAIFALHPVHVESVAWISELKNTLSTVLYLSAALVYLRFDESRRARHYLVALLLFVLALLAKTVTATLPAALLVVFWWRRGRVNARRDAAPLIPFFLVGIAAGLFTLWVERELIGAQGSEFDFTLIERVLIAGRVVWFYLGKLFWPANLTFIYPRWDVNAAVWWQYAFPVVLVALLIGFWLLRRRSRAPLAVLLLFCGTLLPVLGFFDVFPFRYSFVADHFQYLASIPVIAVTAAALTRVTPRAALLLLIVVPLGLLTYRQSSQYASAETLYRATLERNPRAWLAHNNLALVLLGSGRTAEARTHILEALRLNPAIAEHHMNIGRLLIAEGSLDEAIAHLTEAIRLDPDGANAYNNLGVALLRSGRPDEAVAHFQQAVRIEPAHGEANQNLAAAHYFAGAELFKQGSIEEAAERFRAALAIDSELATAHNDLGAALQTLGRVAEAIPHFEESVRLQPENGNAHFNLANALYQAGRVQDAIAHYEQALRLNPGDEAARYNLAQARRSPR